jgi:uncharacterized membrane protein YccC
MPSKVSMRVGVGVAVSSLASLIGIGTVLYKYLEDWTWIQSFYFSVVTLATVGYGDLHPTTDGARLFTAFYILLGVAMAVSALAVIGSSYLTRRDERTARRMHRKDGDSSGSPLSETLQPSPKDSPLG